MDNNNQGNRRWRRKRGGKGRKDKQMSSSSGPETNSTSKREENPTGPNNTSGGKGKAGNKPGPIRQIDDKLKPKSPVGISQADNRSGLKNRNQNPHLLSRGSPAHEPSHYNTGSSHKTSPRTIPGGVSQSQDLKNNAVSRKEEKTSLTQTIAPLIPLKPHANGTNSGSIDCRAEGNLLRQPKSHERTQAQSDGSSADLQISNNTVGKKEANTSLCENKESSGHMRPRYVNRKSGKTESGPRNDLFRQTKQMESLQQRPFPCRSDELVSVIVEMLVTNGGSIQMSYLQNSHKSLYRDMLRLSSDNTLEGFIQDHRHVLGRSPDTGNVKVMSLFSALDICKEHGSSVGSCGGGCRSLHICKFQMMNECSRGKKCLFGHNLRTNYNDNVLKTHNMERLSDKQVREFLGTLDNRSGLTIPGICSYYNSMKGCGKPDKCPFLHVCEHYIRDDCRYGIDKCCHSHDLSDTQPQCILKRYGLSGTNISDLKRIICKELVSKDEDFSSRDEDSMSPLNVYDSDAADIKLSGRPASNLCSSYSQIRNKLGRSDDSCETEDSSSSSCDDTNSCAVSNDHGEETDTHSEEESGIRGQFPTVNQLEPAWPGERTHESLQQAPKEEHGDYIMPSKIPSSPDDSDIHPQETQRHVSYDYYWRLSTGSDIETTELTDKDQQELDFLYQTYLRARQCTTSLSGQTMTINFETMTGSIKTGEDERIVVIRKEKM